MQLTDVTVVPTIAPLGPIATRMSRYFLLPLLLCGVALLLWQLTVESPMIRPLAAGASLLFVGLLLGLRWGERATQRIVGDLLRLNRHLGEQNGDLAEINLSLIRHLRSTPQDATESGSED